MMNNNLQLWLDAISKEFKVESSIEHVSKQFIDWKVKIADPHGKGAGFYLTFNNEGEASSLDMDEFEFRWLNIAEGYSSKEILDVADSILRGNFTVSPARFYGKAKLCFTVESGEVCAKARSSTTPIPAKYEMM